MEKLIALKDAVIKWIADNPKKNVAVAAFAVGFVVGGFLL